MSVCLSDETIDAFRRGRLPEDRLIDVTRHLDACAECRRRLDDPRDTPILDDLRVVMGRRGVGESSTPTRLSCAEGSCLGHYRIGRLLGEGGMARVFTAVDTENGRDVAFKILKPQYQADANYCTRFKREVESMARIRHESVVRIYEFFQMGDTSAIIMELVTGGSLRDRLNDLRVRQSVVPVAEAVDMILQAARGIAVAHRMGMVHRDVKPSNLLLDGGGRVKVADFGTILMLEGTTWLTGVGQQIGTPAYMSPEQCRGQRVTPASDVYALGATLYEMLTGHVPFEAEEASPLALMLKQISEQPPDPRQYREDIPRWLAGVIGKCLEKKPGHRYAGAGELADALRDGPAAYDEIPLAAETHEAEESIDLASVRNQLCHLPQRAIVYWACRCARRVQMLNTDPRVEKALLMAEAMAGGAEAKAPSPSLSRALSRIRSLRVASLKAAYADETPVVATAGAAEAARAAAAASSAAAARCIDDAAADAAFAARNAVAALRVAGRSVKTFWAATRKDYQKLLSATAGQEGTVGQPLPPGLLDE